MLELFKCKCKKILLKVVCQNNFKKSIIKNLLNGMECMHENWHKAKL